MKQSKQAAENELDFRTSSFSNGSNCVKVAFKTSTYSNGGNCVEVGACECDTVYVRDSKDKTNQIMAFARDQWSAFIKGVKHGEFDVM